MSKIILPQLVDNLESLRAHEEQIRVESVSFINSTVSLQEHISLIHICMDMLQWMYGRVAELDSDRLVALTGFRVRLFNSISCSLKLLLTGYYQGSISFIRDIIEVSFLLDYFSMDDSAIERWIKNPDNKEFRPINVRYALDKRDGLSEQLRKQKYKLLSTYGAHVTFDGNRLFSNNDLLTIGPFLNLKFLEGILFELTLSIPHPILTCMRDESKLEINDFLAKRDFFTTLHSWWKNNMNSDFSDIEFGKMQEIFKLLGLK